MKIICSLLSWNVLPLTRRAAEALLREVRRARDEDGLDACLLFADNGSTDGTRQWLEKLDMGLVPSDLMMMDKNIGNARGRNAIIEQVLASGADYWFSVDGDVEVVPGSLTAFYEEMKGQGERCCAIAAHDLSGVPDRALVARHYRRVTGIQPMVRNMYTNYVLFRSDPFRQGIRFCDAAEFAGPGWGFEDNDLACQLFAADWYAYYVDDLIYLHRHINSSVSVLKNLGVDPEANAAARQARLIERWGGHPNPKVKVVVDWVEGQTIRFPSE